MKTAGCSVFRKHGTPLPPLREEARASISAVWTRCDGELPWTAPSSLPCVAFGGPLRIMVITTSQRAARHYRAATLVQMQTAPLDPQAAHLAPQRNRQAIPAGVLDRSALPFKRAACSS